MILANKIWLLILNGRVCRERLQQRESDFCCLTYYGTVTRKLMFSTTKVLSQHSTLCRIRYDYDDSYGSLLQELSISNSKCEISWTINIMGVLGLTFFRTSLFCYRLISCTRTNNLSLKCATSVMRLILIYNDLIISEINFPCYQK